MSNLMNSELFMSAVSTLSQIFYEYGLHGTFYTELDRQGFCFGMDDETLDRIETIMDILPEEFRLTGFEGSMYPNHIYSFYIRCFISYKEPVNG